MHRTVGRQRAFAGLASNSDLRRQQRKAKGERQHQIAQQEDAAAVLGRQIREAPDVPQAHRAARRREHEADGAGKGASLFLVFHIIPPIVSFLSHHVLLYYPIPFCATPFMKIILRLLKYSSPALMLFRN